MKKLILGLFIVAGSLAFAQEKTEFKSPIGFGVKAGLNLSHLNSIRTGKAGFNVGIFASIPLANSFTLQPEALYSQYGAFVPENKEVASFAQARLNLDYITVPVMLQYNVSSKFYVEAGPEFGLMVNNKFKTENGTSLKFGYGLNKFNLGLGLGLGFNFSKNFGFNARYIAGLTNPIKKAYAESMANSTFQLGVTYKFK
ncbi:porin family protein [Chryseobacterium sp. MEBOG07]|uniref:porin family protein n=1 Tax=Chryseobacterium sp. MEBOG07 TaxID=2879939 RepID=UPI001F2B64D5|nr:porin family protein [Chryseobacterium sp. MEBOG07]UKB78319.1 PorT family protein [Chryseobacterium sp. MEBOG07]